MKYPIIILLALIVGLFSTSCNQQVKEERIKRIDSLGVHLNYVNESLEQIDSVLLSNRIADIERNGDWLYENITDTLKREPGLAFADFLRSKKYFNRTLSRYNEVKAELAYSEAQLATLRNDVQNSFYSDEEFAGYFGTESASVSELVNTADNLTSSYESTNAQFDQLKPRITEIVDSIKTIIYDDMPLVQ